jgi:FkbM family methyltransferase
MATMYFQKRAKQIYSIEPDPRTFECLEKNTQKYSNVKRFNYAIGHQNDVVLPISKDSLFNPDPENAIGVTTKTFGTFIKDNKITHIDVLKIDCEGWEYIIFAEDSFIECSKMIDCIVGESHYHEHVQPRFIPIMLNEMGFTTSFNPNKNYISVARVVVNGKQKEFRLAEATNFIAVK